MKAFVFTDEALRGQAGRFVWLEIDMEKAQNAAFRKQFPVRALPSYLVVEPDSQQVLLRWVGAATVPQLGRILDDAVAGHARFLAGGGAAPGAGKAKDESPSPDDLLAQADRLYGAGDNARAAEIYYQAVMAAPDDWPSYPRAAESLLLAWAMGDNCKAAASMARDLYPPLARTPSAANVAVIGLDCALELPADDPQRHVLVEFLELAARKLARDMTVPMSDDDRSGVYISLLSAREAAKDSLGARRVAEEWSAFLEEAAARAPSPEARTVYDSHRLSAYVELGQPEKAVPMLEASERDLPDDYNPPARLAVAFRHLKKWDDALKASDRALARVYGPRKIVVYQARAEIYLGKGDPGSARSVLEEAIKYAEALPDGQRSEGAIASLRKRIEALPKS